MGLTVCLELERPLLVTTGDFIFLFSHTVGSWMSFQFEQKCNILAVTFLDQAQLREVTLREENAAFEKAISDCGNKIQEKLQEANLLQSKLQVRDEVPIFLSSFSFHFLQRETILSRILRVLWYSLRITPN